MFNKPTITVMRTTSSIQFYCRNCKTDKQGFSPIEISLTINGKRTFIHLPRKERPADFLKETSKKKSELNDNRKSPVCVTTEAQVPLTLESKFRMTPIKS